ncbi:MAG: hypothetical protein JWP81_3860, partial [Ferruginibacter sp.]|nr:hypothetical protein [Ferruginibacter sp.]
LWNGNSYNTVGSYIVTLVNSAGCDSIATLNLKVKAATVSTTTVNICPLQLPYSWNGNSYNAAGSYNVTLVNTAGCDSIATLSLVVKAATVSTINVSVCPSQLPYSWNGNAYNVAGSYNVTLVNSAGCDSIATLNLVIKAATASTTTVSSCPSQLPYLWNGNSYNAAGSYNVTLVNSAGCDSIATLNLAVEAATVSTTNVSVCPSQLPYSWNGNTYNITGSYNITLVNAAGCDSVATLNLAVKAATTSLINVSVCPSQLPYSWNGNAYNAAGSYNVTLVNSVGCDSIATLTLVVKAATVSTTNVSVCPSQLPYLWNGNSYNTVGSYIVTLVNSAGCDSIATLNLKVKAATVSTTTVNICPLQLPYSWNGNTYGAAGSYKMSFVNANGCDSVAILNLSVTPIVTSTTNISICSSQMPYSWNGKTYTSKGTYNVTLVNAAGCDSVATLALKVIDSAVTQTVTLTSCDTVVFNHLTYTSSTVIRNTIKSIGGCDSIYSVTNINISNQNFDLTLTATPNPAKKGATVKIVTSALVPYSITSWQPSNIFSSQNLTSQSMIADTATLIRVTAKSAAGCIATASLNLVIDHSDFYIPNAFTPNDDGKNDYFSVYGTTIKSGLLRIYNQWGQLLFESTNIKKGWNGVYKGVPQPVGVYAYVVFAEMYDGKKVTDYGFLNLIR